MVETAGKVETAGSVGSVGARMSDGGADDAMAAVSMAMGFVRRL
jgi:hypothetical protein